MFLAPPLLFPPFSVFLSTLPSLPLSLFPSFLPLAFSMEAHSRPRSLHHNRRRCASCTRRADVRAAGRGAGVGGRSDSLLRLPPHHLAVLPLSHRPESSIQYAQPNDGVHELVHVSQRNNRRHSAVSLSHRSAPIPSQLRRSAFPATLLACFAGPARLLPSQPSC